MEWRTLSVAAGLAAGLTFGMAVRAQAAEGQPVPQPNAEATKSVEQWVADLGSESYKTRLDAEKVLRGLGQASLPELRKAAAATTDNEVQWRARRLVRQIEGGATGALQQRARPEADGGGVDAPRPPRLFGRAVPQGVPDDVRNQFEDLFRQMERDFGLDIPRGRFFQDDFFRDLQDQLKTGAGQSQGMSMQIGPDGAVKVEVQQKNAQGEVENKVYEAPDLQTFHKQYPGVLQQNGLGGGLQFWIDRQGGAGAQPWQIQRNPGQLGGRVLQGRPLQPRAGQPQGGVGLEPEDQQPDFQDLAQPVPPPDGKRLGVFIRPEISPEVREYLGLEDGRGLLVESVQDGSLAVALGLQHGDIVVKIGERAIGSTDDVQQALAAIEVGKPVEVVFLRKGVEKLASAPKPEVAAAEPPKKALRRLESTKKDPQPKPGEKIR